MAWLLGLWRRTPLRASTARVPGPCASREGLLLGAAAIDCRQPFPSVSWTGFLRVHKRGANPVPIAIHCRVRRAQAGTRGPSSHRGWVRGGGERPHCQSVQPLGANE